MYLTCGIDCLAPSLIISHSLPTLQANAATIQLCKFLYIISSTQANSILLIYGCCRFLNEHKWPIRVSSSIAYLVWPSLQFAEDFLSIQLVTKRFMKLRHTLWKLQPVRQLNGTAINLIYQDLKIMQSCQNLHKKGFARGQVLSTHISDDYS